MMITKSFYKEFALDIINALTDEEIEQLNELRSSEHYKFATERDRFEMLIDKCNQLLGRHRYIVFTFEGSGYGGWGDYDTSFDILDEARQYAKGKSAQVIDTYTLAEV